MNEKQKTIIIWATIVMTGMIVGVLCFKLAVSEKPLSIEEIGMTDILAFALSIFAIWMSVSFYHKASDSANLFYDNTYKFTRDVSETLGRIEGAFGEKLSHIDTRVSSLPNSISNVTEEIQKKQEKLDNLQAENETLRVALEKNTAQTEEERKILLERYEQAVQDKANTQRQVIALDNRLKELRAERNFLMHRESRLDSDLSEAEVIKELTHLRTEILPTIIQFESNLADKLSKIRASKR